MILNIFRKNENNKNNDNEINNFKNELQDKLDNKYRIENCLYQVVDFSEEGVFLQNKETKIIFEEKDLPQDLKSKIATDYILRYKNGSYIIEEELTDELMS